MADDRPHKRELGVISRCGQRSPRSGCGRSPAPWGLAKVGWRERRLPGAGAISVNWAAGSSAAQAIQLGAFVRWLPADAPDPLRATQRRDRRTSGARRLRALCGRGGRRPSAWTTRQPSCCSSSSTAVLAHVVLTVCNGVAVSDAVAGLWRGGPLRRDRPCSRSRTPTMRNCSNRHSAGLWIR